MRVALGVAVSLVALAAGCGGDAATPTTIEAPTTTGTETVETTAKPPAVRRFTIVVTDGSVQGGIARPAVDEGEKVTIVVRTNAGESVHLHGYNLTRPVVDGEARVVLTASIPGRFELELHHPDVVLADLEVTP